MQPCGLPAQLRCPNGRWWALKSRFTRSLAKAGRVRPRNAKGEYDLWQRRYWEHTVRDEADLARHVDYIHCNPVKPEWVDRVRDWPYSSFHRFVATRRTGAEGVWVGIKVCMADDPEFRPSTCIQATLMSRFDINPM